MSDESPQRDTNLIRAVRPGIEFRAATEDDDLGDEYLGLLRVLFSPVNEWTEINSMWEGNFLERFAPGAWKKTIRETGDKIRSLFQHGMDPQVGDKPLGPIRKLEENDEGGYGEIALLDTSYNRDLLPGLKAGLYGASHRFRVMREEIIDKPEPSEHNPHGLPERTVKEAGLKEFGPVTFPAYAGATAGVRSLTDEFIMSCFRSDSDRLRHMFDMAQRQEAEAPSEDDAETEESHLVEERRDGEQDAPSEDESQEEAADERRESDTAPRGPRKPIYGTRRKETSKPWLLGPSKSTKRS